MSVKANCFVVLSMAKAKDKCGMKLFFTAGRETAGIKGTACGRCRENFWAGAANKKRTPKGALTELKNGVCVAEDALTEQLALCSKLFGIFK